MNSELKLIIEKVLNQLPANEAIQLANYLYESDAPTEIRDLREVYVNKLEADICKFCGTPLIKVYFSYKEEDMQIWFERTGLAHIRDIRKINDELAATVWKITKPLIPAFVKDVDVSHISDEKFKVLLRNHSQHLSLQRLLDIIDELLDS